MTADADYPADEAIPIRRAPTDVPRLLRTATEVLAEQAAAIDVGLRLTTAADVPTAVLVDPEKLAWAITTLIGNALRYARPGTRRMPGGSIDISVAYVEPRRELVVTVQDDGPGIPAEKIPYLFERAAGATHAAGLGLKLIHDVVSAHGGAIEVKSSTDAFDHGTAITLRVPAR
jgi:signal transduction histidine kinase